MLTNGRTTDDGGTQTQDVASGPITVPRPVDPLPLLLYVVAGIVALLAIFGPPALALQLRKRRSQPSTP